MIDLLTVGPGGVVLLTTGVHEQVHRPTKELVDDHGAELVDRGILKCLPHLRLSLLGNADELVDLPL